MRIIITGAAGFIGGFLNLRCKDEGCSLLGLDIVEPRPEMWGDSDFELCDIRDTDRLSRTIAKFRPDRIFHLAAHSFPTVSLHQPRETIDVNVIGTVNLFECVRSAGILPMVVVACSSAEYGPVASEDLPVKESHPLQPLHPYGVSKVGQDLLASQYFANYSIPVVRIRIFNTTGPGKIGDVCSDFARRAIEIELGIQEAPLKVGNLFTKRAIADARDLVDGLWLSAERCEAGEVYNLGGDRVYAMQEIIDAIRSHLGANFPVQPDPTLVRSCDEAVIWGDTTKFRGRTGWAPVIDLNQTLRDMLRWWRERLTADRDRSLVASGEPNWRKG
jgi:GDP-4-dehydro-6-deoxy-D-mannose reductase